MLTTSSSSQYLHPDYLQPLPTTLDAKKSPLALLAQTCSSIGKDTPPSKPIIPPLEKKESDKSHDKSGDQKRPASSDDRKESGRDSKPGFRTVPPKEIPPLVPISSGGGEKHSSSVSESGKSSSESTTVSNVITRPVSSTGSNSSGHGSRGSEKGDHHDPPTSHSTSPHHMKPSSAHSTPILPTPTSLGSMKPSISHASLLGALPTAPHLAYSALPLMGHPGLHVDVQASSPAYHHSSLAAHASLTAAAAQSSALKASAAAAAATSAALSPYVAYARVRTPSGATTLVPVCRDPYCTNCQLTLQNSHLSSTCTAPGCSQCAHEKSLTSLTSGLGIPGASSLPILPPLSSAGTLASSASGLSSFHSLYQHSALASQGLPYICNWVAGSEYCGKRFTTSEELLQHLRTHTSSMDASSLAANYGLGIPSAAALAACHGHYPAPAPLSPNSLRRSYPTSLSPVSSLLGANRYHPYKSPLASVPPSPQAYPALSPYYSPYALYGQRLGAAAVP